jgi:hypothetical protein
MKNIEEAQRRAAILRARLVGQISNTYNSIIFDVFVVPNQWFLAKSVYRERKNYAGFPFKEWDDLTIITELTNDQLEPVKDIVLQDGYDDLKELVYDLPDMIGSKEEQDKNRTQEDYH